MNSNNSVYVRMMVDVLKRKEKILQQILEQTKEQEVILKQEDIDYDRFQEHLENTPIQNTLSLTSTARVNTLKSKTKTVRYYNDNNVLCWSYALKASFKVKKGTNAIYDSSSASAKIYKTSWNTVSEKHFGSKNTATGSITMKTTKKTVTKKITIKCDKDGNFS